MHIYTPICVELFMKFYLFFWSSFIIFSYVKNWYFEKTYNINAFDDALCRNYFEIVRLLLPNPNLISDWRSIEEVSKLGIFYTWMFFRHPGLHRKKEKYFMYSICRKFFFNIEDLCENIFEYYLMK